MIVDAPISVEDYAIDDAGHACGAVVTFKGVVRAENHGRAVTRICYDCYREMAENEMQQIIDEMLSTSRALAIRAIHRVGNLEPGDLALLVVAAAGHRNAAFDVAMRTADEIKRRVPIWKQEHYADSTAQWL